MYSHLLRKTDSIQGLAHFWDMHDLTEFEDQLEQVGEPVSERDTYITVRPNSDDANTVREVARVRGVPESDLIREWVLERIHGT